MLYYQRASLILYKVTNIEKITTFPRCRGSVPRDLMSHIVSCGVSGIVPCYTPAPRPVTCGYIYIKPSNTVEFVFVVIREQARVSQVNGFIHGAIALKARSIFFRQYVLSRNDRFFFLSVFLFKQYGLFGQCVFNFFYEMKWRNNKHTTEKKIKKKKIKQKNRNKDTKSSKEK